MKVVSAALPEPGDRGGQPELRLTVPLPLADTPERSLPFDIAGAAMIEQAATYIDTHGQELLRAGFSLHVRETDGSPKILVLMAETHAAQRRFGRREWQGPLADGAPALAAIGTSLLKTFTGITVHALAPIFTIRTRAMSRSIARGSASIAAAFVQTRISAGDRDRRVAEIILRLERGTPRDLHAVAREWGTGIPLRIGATGDFEHGQILLDPVGEPLKVMKTVAFLPEMPAEASFAAMVGAGLRHFRVSEERLRLSPVRADLIQLAASVRHLHVALALFEDMLKGSDLDRFRSEFGWLARELSEILTADLIATRAGQTVAAGESDRMGDEGAARLSLLFDSRRYRSLPLDFAEWAAVGEWRSSNIAAEQRQRLFAEFAAAGLIRIRKRLKDWARHRQRLDLAERQQTLAASKRLRQVAEIIVKPGQTRRADLFSNALDDFEAELGELSGTASVHAALNELAMIEGRQILAPRIERDAATDDTRGGAAQR